MKLVSKIGAALFAAFVLSSTASAAKINGVIGFTGGAALNNANLSLATQVVEWDSPEVSVIHTSDFATILTGTGVLLKDPWDLNTAAPGITNFWQVGGFSFDLITSTRYYDPSGAGFLSASGYGVIKKFGFDDTIATWSFSTQNPGSDKLFTISASGAAVPDGGATVALLGVSLLGLHGLRRKFSKR
jgi:hypothetical protein